MERLIIFFKAPQIGRVKTRLAEKIGVTAALQAYESIWQVLAGNLLGVEGVEVRFSPAEAFELVHELLPPRWAARAQKGNDLGERLANALREAFAEGSRKVVIIGSDCPYVREDHIREASRLLEENDLVVGPALDGGYWLIGMKALRTELFENVPWSTNQVLNATLKCARDLALRVKLLEELEDIDTFEAWNRFSAFRRGL